MKHRNNDAAMADHLVLGALRAAEKWVDRSWMLRREVMFFTSLRADVVDRSLARLRAQKLVENVDVGTASGRGYRWVNPKPPCGSCKRFPCLKWKTCRKPLIPDEVGGIE